MPNPSILFDHVHRVDEPARAPAKEYVDKPGADHFGAHVNGDLNTRFEHLLRGAKRLRRGIVGGAGRRQSGNATGVHQGAAWCKCGTIEA